MKKHLMNDNNICKQWIYEFNKYGLNVRYYNNYQGKGEKYIIVVIKDIKPHEEHKYIWSYDPLDNNLLFTLRNKEIKGDEYYSEAEFNKVIEIMKNIA